MFGSLALSAALLAGVAVSAPVDVKTVKRTASASAPHFVVYQDIWQQPPSSGDLQGFNTVALSFWTVSQGPADAVAAWQALDQGTRDSVKSDYGNAGINLLCAAFGATDAPTTNGADPVATADQLADFVTANGFDGVDVDYEDTQAMAAGTGEAWLVSFTQELRNKLPAGQYVLTHAPMAPWFGVNGAWPNGAYTTVNSQVGSLIDWYNVQFYNQGDYGDCGSLISSSVSTPGTALDQIISTVGDGSKVVLGKPATSSDAGNGYVDPGTLAGCVSQATSSGWNGGIMFWQWHDASTGALKAQVWGS